MGKKEWDEAATVIAQAVIGVMPQLNEYKIRARVYAFFAAESDYTQGIYDDSNFYYTQDVISILEKAFDETQGDEQTMVVTSDFRWAFDQLSDSYQYRILERFQHSVVRPGDSPERAQLNRAIRKLADILNSWNRMHEYEGTGSREVRSNASATATIDKQEAGWGVDPDGPFRFDGGRY